MKFKKKPRDKKRFSWVPRKEKLLTTNITKTILTYSVNFLLQRYDKFSKVSYSYVTITLSFVSYPQKTRIFYIFYYLNSSGAISLRLLRHVRNS